MKLRIFLNPFELQPGMYSFTDFKDALVKGDLDEHIAAQFAQNLGAPIKRTFQSTSDDNGAYILGLRYKPVAIVVPEGHPKFLAKIIISGKMPK